MTQKNIEGIIYFNVNSKSYDFMSGMRHLSETGFYKSEYAHWIYVCDHTLTFDLPDNFDTITPQLNALDAKEKELKIQYHQALEHIKVQRNNLLAIEG